MHADKRKCKVVASILTLTFSDSISKAHGNYRRHPVKAHDEADAGIILIW